MPRPQSETDGRRPARATRLGVLALCLAGMSLVWGVLLPRGSGHAGVRQFIDRNEALGIDPSAKFYSELPASEGILLDMQEDHVRRNLWTVSPRQ